MNHGNYILQGRFRHQRWVSKHHQFQYPIALLMLDIDKWQTTTQKIPLLSFNRFNIAHIRRRDYLDQNDKSLSDIVRQACQKKFQQWPEGPISIITHPAYFGYCFNPISLYLVWDKTGQQLQYWLAEVHNTPWGERHLYVMQATSCKPLVYEAVVDKAMHVSPFMTMDYQYHMRLDLRNEGVHLQIKNMRQQSCHFAAHMTLTAKALTPKNWLSTLVQYPFLTQRIVIRIYWQAFRLWLKKVPFISHPDRIHE